MVRVIHCAGIFCTKVLESSVFHAPSLVGSSLCLLAPGLFTVLAVSVSFHSLQGAGLHCSYEHRLGTLQTLGPNPT